MAMKSVFLFLAITLFTRPHEALRMEQIGCYKDGPERDLPYLARDGYLTPMICKNLCEELKYAYFGLQYKYECWCGNEYGQYGIAPEHECNLKCSGDENTLCGGRWRNLIYKTGIKSPALGMRLLGCFKDNNNSRDLPHLALKGDVTPTICYNLCKKLKYAYAGVQVKNECWCGSSYGQYGNVSIQECNQNCTGELNTYCGSYWRNRIYTVDLTSDTLGIEQIGCYKDGPERDLPYLARDENMTPMICKNLCEELKYAYFGLQVEYQCWCGNEYGQYGIAHEHECNLKCSGDENTLCGGRWRNRIYKTGIKSPGLGMRLLGCFKDNNNSRDLPHLALRGHATPTICYNLCKKIKYAYAGVQGKDKCWCGNSYGQYGKVSTQECKWKCKGNAYCGAPWRNRIYTVDLTSDSPPVPPMMEYVGCLFFQHRGRNRLVEMEEMELEEWKTGLEEWKSGRVKTGTKLEEMEEKGKEEMDETPPSMKETS